MTENRTLRTSYGFTMVELLCCITIVSILAAITFPVLRAAKQSANQSVTISNFRQCYVALQLYNEDRTDAPTYDQAVVALKNSPTHDPADYWKLGTGPGVMPMINSYAYIRGVSYAFSTEAQWRSYVSERESGGKVIPWMASIWQGEPHPKFVSSDEAFPPSARFAECWLHRTCMLPDKFTYLLSDGAIKSLTSRITSTTNKKYIPLFWDHVFQPQYTRKEIQ